MIVNKRELLMSGLSLSLASILRSAEAKMMEPLSIDAHITYSTARIVGKITNSTDTKTGTGFFFNFPTDTQQIVTVLITNTHVIEGTERIQFLIHTTTDTDAPSADAEIDSVSSDWTPHPDPKIDLCGLVVGPTMKSMDPIVPLFRALDASLVKSDNELNELNAVEPILMAGYPNGLWDAANTFPLLERGITASHPALDFDVEGVATTVVDIAIFPGSSGSPVFIYNDGSYADKSGHTMIGNRVIFLGVLFSGQTFQPDGTLIIKNIPTANGSVPVTNMVMKLGYIIKAKEVSALGAAIFAKHRLSPPPMPKPASTPEPTQPVK